MNRHYRRIPLLLLVLVALAAVVIFAVNSPAPTGAAGMSSAARTQHLSQPASIDCSSISSPNSDKQTNLHAQEILAQCGKVEVGPPAARAATSEGGAKKSLAPLSYGSTDVDIVLPDDVVGDVQSPIPGPAGGCCDYVNANGSLFYQAWIDGRVITSNTSQPDKFFDRSTIPQTTPTPSPTPVCNPLSGHWGLGANLPTTVVHGSGVYFPANGRFYVLGGYAPISYPSCQGPYEYDPATNTWIIKTATYPDNQVFNMACGKLEAGGTPWIYCVGGTQLGGTVATGRVFRYDPIADTIQVVAGDDWPGVGAGNDTIPGGYTVVNNRLYIVGGFRINSGTVNAVWEYDPNAGGAHWTQKASMPVARAYVPAAPVGNYIYTAGGSDYQGGTLVDTNDSFRYDTTADTWIQITNTPRATGETQAVAVGGQVWVLGGGRTAPNPSNEVDAYNPASNSWTQGPPLILAIRNGAADSDGARIWLAGGYAPNTPSSTLQVFVPPTSCATSTPIASPTNTPVPPTATMALATATDTATSTTAPSATDTATSTTAPSATATSCPIQFTDVPPGSTFYDYVRCLACRGVVSGYPDGTFRPGNNVSRGQLTKMVANAAGWNDEIPPDRQTFEDVPPGSTFWLYVERAVLHWGGQIGGYPCGGPGEPCIPPSNRPYFRPNSPATRGQVAKIVAQFLPSQPPPSGQIFEDVPPESPFYIWIERLAASGIVSGYPCGGPGEPCVPPNNRPYFRPNSNVSRGQAAKMVANTLFPGCSTNNRP